MPTTLEVYKSFKDSHFPFEYACALSMMFRFSRHKAILQAKAMGMTHKEYMQHIFEQEFTKKRKRMEELKNKV